MAYAADSWRSSAGLPSDGTRQGRPRAAAGRAPRHNRYKPLYRPGRPAVRPSARPDRGRAPRAALCTLVPQLAAKPWPRSSAQCSKSAVDNLFGQFSRAASGSRIVTASASTTTLCAESPGSVYGKGADVGSNPAELYCATTTPPACAKSFSGFEPAPASSGCAAYARTPSTTTSNSDSRLRSAGPISTGATPRLGRNAGTFVACPRQVRDSQAGRGRHVDRHSPEKCWRVHHRVGQARVPHRPE